MTAYQIEELLERVLLEKEAIPIMHEKMDWQSFEKDLRHYVDVIYKKMEWQ